MKKCRYGEYRGGAPDKNYCVDACEDCKYFLDGTETKNIVIQIRDVPISENTADLINEIELAYESFVAGSLDYLDIELIDERMN